MNQETIITSCANIPKAQGSRNMRRECHRPRQFKSGRIIVERENMTIDCIIRDQTETGARLRIDSQLCIPRSFNLIALSANNKFSCEVVWRRGFEIGVKYIQKDK